MLESSPKAPSTRAALLELEEHLHSTGQLQLSVALLKLWLDTNGEDPDVYRLRSKRILQASEAKRRDARDKDDDRYRYKKLSKPEL